MGIYVYRVTAKQVTCSDGKKANVATFAYKPYGGWGEEEKLNKKMHFTSGATASDRLAHTNRLTDRFVYGDENGVPYHDAKVYHNVDNLGTFYDDLGSFPVIEGVTV